MSKYTIAVRPGTNEMVEGVAIIGQHTKRAVYLFNGTTTGVEGLGVVRESSTSSEEIRKILKHATCTVEVEASDFVAALKAFVLNRPTMPTSTLMHAYKIYRGDTAGTRPALFYFPTVGDQATYCLCLSSDGKMKGGSLSSSQLHGYIFHREMTHDERLGVFDIPKLLKEFYPT